MVVVASWVDRIPLTEMVESSLMMAVPLSDVHIVA